MHPKCLLVDPQLVHSRSWTSSSYPPRTSVRSEDLKVVNENGTATAFEYFSVPLVYCINQDFQNFDKSNKEEISPILKILIN